MTRVKYEDWVIDVDLEKTKEYYNNYVVSKNQIQQNYIKYCENLTHEEKMFFNSFGINPICCNTNTLSCNTNTLGITKEKTLPTDTYYLISGEFVSYPQEDVLSIEELEENNFVDERKDPRIKIGIFEFDFQNPNNIFYYVPDDMPQGFICIQVWIESLPWLLNEDCEEKMYYPPKWWELLRKIKEHKLFKVEENNRISELTNGLENNFANLNISFQKLEENETKNLMVAWIKNFALTISKQDIKELSIMGNKKYCNYLWHAFTNNEIPSEISDNAPVCFNNIIKNDCYLVLNNEIIAYKINGNKLLISNIINKYIYILVFDCDFTWTYCHTHEADCGPYFYNKNNPPPHYDPEAIEVIKSADGNRYIEILEKNNVFTFRVMQKEVDDYENSFFHYWCPVIDKGISFFDTKEKAIAEAMSIIK